MRFLIFIFGILVLPLFLSNTNPQKFVKEQAIPFLDAPSPWADSVFAQLSLDEKIGQLFNIAAYSNKDDKHIKELEDLIQNYHIGGLTFFQGGPIRQAQLTNRYQALSKLPLMIAIDGEWGLSMRLDSTMKYPWQMTLGAIQDDELLYKMGLDVAAQFRRIGVHVNFAPVIDVNNNPKNPVIFARSFGEDKENVARKGIAYMKGMQDGKLLACAKHFPGHGDTDTDSHITLPIVNQSPGRIDSIELYPFKQLIGQGVGSIMSAHLFLPQLTQLTTASSLNPSIVDTLLKQQLGYQGLVFTDGLNMGGVAKFQKSEEIDLQALLAGNDVLLLSQDVPAAFTRIKAALADSSLSMKLIDDAVLKILRAKEWLELPNEQAIQLDNLYSDLNRPKYQLLNRKLVENSLTLLRNKNNLIPIKKLKDKRIMAVAFTEKGVTSNAFHNSLNLYTKVDTLSFQNLPVSAQKNLMDTLLDYDEIIVSIHKSNKNPWVKADLNTEYKNFLNILRLKRKVSLVVFANAYSLKDFLAAEYVDALLLAYQNSEIAQELSAQLIFGGIKASGKIPVSISTKIPMGLGLKNDQPTIRLKYTLPEELGIKSEELAQIDSIVNEGIREGAYPGAQVYIAKSGKVIYNKAFGKHTYDISKPVATSDIYDLASVTKITSTLLAIMKLDGDGEISLDDELGKHLKMVRGTAYEKLILRDILAHQAGLAAWIPFYVKTLHHGLPRYDLYSVDSSSAYSVRVANDLYIKSEYKDSIFSRIIYRAKVEPDKGYKYSDVGYYFLKELVEVKTKQAIQDYNQSIFYEPLGMNRTSFLPREKFSIREIIPTENDKIFRKQLIHGDVHDPGAAMLGGVGGHAGLFSSANDLGKLMQMYLQNGVYGGERYLKEEVLKEYTKCQFCADSIPTNKEENRRGAGFDKPQLHGEPGPTCECISFKSYGHSGFTGTYTWVDPEEELVYIFLSNRVYPDANNSKLVKLNIRTRIQEQIYTAVNNMKHRSLHSTLNRNQ